MKSIDYWKRRAEQRMYEALEMSEGTAGFISRIYAMALEYLTGKADGVFERYQVSEKMTREEALAMIRAMDSIDDMRELERRLEAENDAGAEARLKALRNAGAYGSRLKRLGDLLQQVSHIMTSVYSQTEKAVTGVLKDIASDSYLKTIYDFQQRIGTGFSVSHIDPKVVDKILKTNWSGKHFSKRLWDNTDRLAEKVKEEMVLGALTGKTEREMAEDISTEMGRGMMESRRLVRTESCHVSAEVNAQAYEDVDIEMYMYLATLDLRTSSICRELDGKRFPVKDHQAGVNYPPMHPWCRSTTIAIVDEEYLEGMTRTMRDPETGRNQQVPLSMTYEQWYKKYVDKDTNQKAKGNRIDWMSNSLNPRYGNKETVKAYFKNSKRGADDIEKIFELRKVTNSKHNIYAESGITGKHFAVTNADKALRHVERELPKFVKIPDIYVIDFEKHGLGNAAGGYDRYSGLLLINSKIDTKEKLNDFLTKEKGLFSSTEKDAVVFHEMGHKYYYDLIENIAKQDGIEYNKAKYIVDDVIQKHVEKEDNLITALSKYAYTGYAASEVSEVFAESLKVSNTNAFAGDLLEELGGLINDEELDQ